MEDSTDTPIRAINLAEKFSLFSDLWQPKIAGEINDTHIKLVKIKGEFDWHHHEVEDELFLVVKGQLIIRLRDGEVDLHEGEMVIIPHGVEHQPYAPEETQIILLEPKTTLNTGNVQTAKTVLEPGRI